MSSHLLSLYPEGVTLSSDEVPFSRIANRFEQIQRLQSKKNFDIVLYGAGLTNVLIAHEASVQGFSVLMLDSKSIASDALSWDFYAILNLFDAPINIVRAKRVMNQLKKVIAPHLIEPITIDIDCTSLSLRSLIHRYMSLYNVDERLLIREYVLAARQEGATILDEISLDHVEAESKSGCYIVQFRDPYSNKVVRVRGGGIVVDPSSDCLLKSALGTPIISVPSIGREIVFRRFKGSPRSMPSLKSCSCFEYTDGSKVALVKRSPHMYEGVIAPKDKDIPSQIIDSIFASAFETIGWNLESTLCSRELADCFSTSPGYELMQQKGIFYARHRAPWDAFRSAKTIVSIMLSYREKRDARVKFFSRPLPGVEVSGEINAFRAAARGAGVSEKTIEICIKRWRGRVRYIAEYPNGLHEVLPGVLRGEIDMAVLGDQSYSVDSIVTHSLNLSLHEVAEQDCAVIRDRIGVLSEIHTSSSAINGEK